MDPEAESAAISPQQRPVAVIVMGVAGAGKTTIGRLLAKKLALPFLEGDDFHPPENVARMAAGEPLEDRHRWPWLDALGATAAEVEGGSVVIACSALKRAYRDRLAAALPHARFVHLAGRESVIRKRLEGRRGHFMPAALLQSQFEALEPPRPDEDALVVDARRPPRQLVADILEALQLAQ